MTTIAAHVRLALGLALLALAPGCRSESPRKAANTTNTTNAANTEHYVLRTVNGRPLPFVDSIAAVDEKGRPLTELRSGTLDFIGSDSARWTLRYRDLARAQTPMDSTVRPMSYERSREELRLIPGPAPSSMRLLPGIAYNSSWRGDTIRFTTEMYWRDSTGHVSSRPLTLLFVKQ